MQLTHGDNGVLLSDVLPPVLEALRTWAASPVEAELVVESWLWHCYVTTSSRQGGQGGLQGGGSGGFSSDRVVVTYGAPSSLTAGRERGIHRAAWRAPSVSPAAWGTRWPGD